jgi:hypothetical protein
VATARGVFKDVPMHDGGQGNFFKGIRGCKTPNGRHHQAANAVEKFLESQHESLNSYLDELDPHAQIPTCQAYGKADEDRCGSNRILDLFTRSCEREDGAGVQLSEYLASTAGAGHLKFLLVRRAAQEREYVNSFKKAEQHRAARVKEAESWSSSSTSWRGSGKAAGSGDAKWSDSSWRSSWKSSVDSGKAKWGSQYEWTPK